MANNHLTETIIKLRERGVISRAHAEAMLQLVRQLNSPKGKVAQKTLRFMVVKTLAEILAKSLDDR